MKNVFFALAFMLIGTFAFANTEVTSEINIDVKKVEEFQSQDNFDSSIESQSVEDLSFTSAIQVENFSNEDYPCRWRVCTYRNGVLVGCTDWTYGECLDEVVIVAQR
ncbi:hypothetical protein [Mesoflavibacter sp. CH_XMU1422-2]|uniref:hypothetical protein n=1 Tax=Mesoflavibacter sp. CH_XMU1422-2 TaxID=3107770 RepID=UPI003008791F